VSYLARALQEPGGPRPSIETLLHGFVESRCVVHTHADAIVSLTNNDRAADTLEGVYGKDVIALDYRRPGFGISREVAEAIAGRSDARALVLAQHGTITWGATVREAYEATIELITRAEDAAGVAAAIERSLAAFERDYTAYVDAHRGPSVELIDALPRVVLIPGLGMFTIGRDRRTAGIVSDIYHHTIDVIGNATAFG